MSASATSIPATAKPALTAAASMSNGAISNSRWGLRGSEDLGDGNRAFFRLEQGFDVQNGKSSSSGKTFNRLAYVGLDGGKIGALTLGLQNTVIQDLMADHFDPLTVGNYAENSWLPVAMGRVRADNAFRYANTLGDLAVIGQWSNGDKWSDRAAGQQMGISLRYTIGQLGLGGAFQKTFGANDSDKRQQCGTSAPRISSKSSRSSPAISTARIRPTGSTASWAARWTTTAPWIARTTATSWAPAGRPPRAGPSPAPPTMTRPRTSWSTATRASATL